jgi:uncharacterized RDD family membrane protein YckC
MSESTPHDSATGIREAAQAQLVTVRARWTRRLIAAFIDAIIVLVFAFLPTACIGVVDLINLRVHPEHDLAGGWLLLASLSFFSMLYYLSEVKFCATLGKHGIALRILSTDGESRYWQRQLRWSIKVLPLVAVFVISLFAYLGFKDHQSGIPLPDAVRFGYQVELLIRAIPLAIVSIDFGWICLDEERRPLHDRIPGTYVSQQIRSVRVLGFEPILCAREDPPDATSTLPSANRDV